MVLCLDNIADGKGRAMKYLNRAIMAQEAPARWAEQHRRYADDEEMWKTAALQALPSRERTPERIAEIVGDDSLTQLVCDNCKEVVADAVHFEADYNNIRLCFSCLEGAFKLRPT